MNPKPLVCVGVINWNGWQRTVSCLKSLLSTTYLNYWVVVLDNGSSDDSVDHIRAWCVENAPASAAGISIITPDATRALRVPVSTERLAMNVLLAKSPVNLGFAGGANVLADFARVSNASFLWLLNNDAVVSVGTLSALMECAETHDAIVGSLVLSIDDPQQVEFAMGKLPLDLFGFAPWRTRRPEASLWKSDWVTFASVLLPLSVIEARLNVDGFFLDESLFMYVEDIDFCNYAIQSGIPIYVSEAGGVSHMRSASSGGKGNPRTYYYITRNRLLFARRYFSRTAFVAFTTYYLGTRVLVQFWHLAKGNLPTVRAVAEALFDGLAGRSGKWRLH